MLTAFPDRKKVMTVLAYPAQVVSEIIGKKFVNVNGCSIYVKEMQTTHGKMIEENQYVVRHRQRPSLLSALDPLASTLSCTCTGGLFFFFFLFVVIPSNVQ